jgi:predicted esterase
LAGADTSRRVGALFAATGPAALLWEIKRVRRWVLWALAFVCAAWLALAVVLQVLARPESTEVVLHARGGSRLVVVVHGMAGRDAVQPAFDLAREAFPAADLLEVRYDAGTLSNADPFDIAETVEARIHAAHAKADYKSIVLVGHSMGAMLIRKVLLWGHGEEADRAGPKGRHSWVDKVERVVSLAGINRGWSIEPKPQKMSISRYLSFWIGERVARATGTGSLVLSIRRGAPFVADSRVQWIRLARAGALPQVIHLLGSLDDLVSREDATDLGVARGTVFVTLPDTDHANIATGLADVHDPNAVARRDAVRSALLGELNRLDPDRQQVPGVERIIYAVHGIRDRGEWARDVRTAIEARLAAGNPSSRIAPVVVDDKRYGYFAMLPFLLYADRQANVRRFIDEYTENMARYPDASAVDYVGHSNGTYLLASALQQYRTVRVRRVYFAGSVVPTHYPWRRLMDGNRVERVVNVVAAGDWVVAIFPMLFEQMAVWTNSRPTSGALDIGGAGFRGFQDEDDPQGRLHNIQFADGAHSTGVDTTDRAKLEAIVDFALTGNERRLDVFRNVSKPLGWLDMLSNVQWLAWLLLAGSAGGLGWLAFRVHRFAGLAYLTLLLALLNSV